MTRKMLAVAALLLASLLALAACGGEEDSPAGGSAEFNGADVTFASEMIPHHQQAVEMAEIALGKADASSAVRELATGIKQAQDPEIQTMTGWLKQWGATTPAGSMDHGGMGSGMMSDADMEALEQASGKAFDEKWVSMMIAHHEGAIDMARQVLATTADPDVKALADAIIKAQTEEITTMRAMS